VKFGIKLVQASKMSSLKSALCPRAEAANVASVIALKSSWRS